MSRIFERNGTLKIISVIIAIILWLYAVDELNPETTLPISDIPIDIINEEVLNSKKLTLVYEPANRTSIRVKGLVNDIRKVNTANIKAVLDLGAIDRQGTQQILLRIEGLQPREVRLDKAPEVSVTINSITRKTIPVELRVTGKESKGYYVHPSTLSPNSIIIYGAESLVKNVVQGIVKIDLDNNENSIEQSLPIKLINGEDQIIDSRYLKLQQEFATVNIPIYPVKDLDIEPKITGKPAFGYIVGDIEVVPSKLSVNGEPNIVNKIKELTTEAIDIQDAKSDINVFVSLINAAGLYINTSPPQQVNVIIRIVETSIEKSFTIDEYSINNLAEGHTAQIVSEPVVVKIKGLYSTVNLISNESLEPSIDLTGLEAGEHEVPLSLSLPGGLEKINISSEVIKVVIASAE